LRDLRRDLGEEGGFALDAYLGILDNFLRQTSAPGPSATNQSSKPPALQAP
jgi:hypothetical protein